MFVEGVMYVTVVVLCTGQRRGTFLIGILMQHACRPCICCTCDACILSVKAGMHVEDTTRPLICTTHFSGIGAPEVAAQARW